MGVDDGLYVTARTASSIGIGTAIIYTILFVMILTQIIYLHSKLDDKPVNKSLEKYYSVTTMIIIVIFCIDLLFILLNSGFKYILSPAVIIRIIILALLLHMFININEGKHPNRGVIITNLVILYPVLLYSLGGILTGIGLNKMSSLLG